MLCCVIFRSVFMPWLFYALNFEALNTCVFGYAKTNTNILIDFNLVKIVYFDWLPIYEFQSDFEGSILEHLVKNQPVLYVISQSWILDRKYWDHNNRPWGWGVQSLDTGHCRGQRTGAASRPHLIDTETPGLKTVGERRGRGAHPYPASKLHPETVNWN